MRWDNLICCQAKISITSNVVPNCSPAANSCDISGILGHAMTSFSGIRVPLMHTVSPVNATSSYAYDSEIRVITGLVVSFAKPFPFLQSSRLRFGCSLVRCSSVSSLGVSVGAAMGVDDGAAGGDGGRRLKGGDTERRLGGQAAGWPLHSSYHVEVVISSRQHRPA